MSHGRIQHVSVLGLGTMGHGIAQAFAAGGCSVGCYDDQPAARAALAERVAANLRQMADAGILAAQAIPAILKRITVCDSEADALRQAEFVVEAVHEDLAVKQELFARIEPLVSPQTILASNSSSYPITQSGARLRRPERAILTHWFNPPHIVPVVEIVPGRHTSETTTQQTLELHDRIGKLTVRINQEIPGFLVNRVQVALMREVFDLLERGIASAEEIDRAIRGSMGLRLAALGPLAIIDFAGWDITARVYQNLVQDLRSDRQLPAVVQKLLDDGRLGLKAGKGVFDYTPESAPIRQVERDRLYLALVKLLQQQG